MQCYRSNEKITPGFAFYFWFSCKDILKMCCFSRWHKDSLTYQGEAIGIVPSICIPGRHLIPTQILYPFLTSKLRLCSLDNVFLLHLTRAERKIKQFSWSYPRPSLNPLTENRPNAVQVLLTNPHFCLDCLFFSLQTEFSVSAFKRSQT
jgi:hypothetical protein